MQNRKIVNDKTDFTSLQTRGVRGEFSNAPMFYVTAFQSCQFDSSTFSVSIATEMEQQNNNLNRIDV